MNELNASLVLCGIRTHIYIEREIERARIFLFLIDQLNSSSFHSLPSTPPPKKKKKSNAMKLISPF